MYDHDWLAEQFEANRAHLTAVAYRMLGSPTEADDAVQETWLRLSRTDTSDIENLSGWLTTVVARVCLDLLRSRTSRREEPWSADVPEPVGSTADGTDPEHEALLGDTVGPALLVVLDALTPAERVAFVLHDVFGVAFDEIAPIVDRSLLATRQLASRARRRVQGGAVPREADVTQQQKVVDAFLAASRGGDFDALLAVLDPTIVVRIDRTPVLAGVTSRGRGGSAWGGFFAGRGGDAQPALIDGVPGLVWAPGGKPRAVFSFSFTRGRIAQIELIRDPEQISKLSVTILDE
jgi:RNA polymerase sigma-70 factor (ECF subfamily)